MRLIIYASTADSELNVTAPVARPLRRVIPHAEAFMAFNTTIGLSWFVAVLVAVNLSRRGQPAG
jgi:hypothetical protein